MILITPLTYADRLLAPSRVRRYVLIWLRKGVLGVHVDGKDFELTPNSAITITSGQIHSAEITTETVGFVLEFTYDFFCESDRDIELVFHNSLFCHFGMNEVIGLGKSSIVGDHLAAIGDELEQKPYQYLISIHSRIELILVELNRAKLRLGGEIYRPDALFLKFLEALMANFGAKPTVANLAEKLKTTPAVLNRNSKIHTGRTAQAVIYSLTVAEAKRLLTFERLSVKETANRLGFDDQYYFSNFFKKHTGIAPKTFQESVNT